MSMYIQTRNSLVTALKKGVPVDTIWGEGGIKGYDGGC